MSDINDRIAALEAQLAELKQDVAAPEATVAGAETSGPETSDAGTSGAETSDAETSDTTTRRGMLRKVALGAAGVATVGAVLGKSALPAAAAHQAEDVGLNISNSSTASTVISYSGSAPGTNIFTAHDGITGSTFPAAVGGYATGAAVPNGVYGYTSGTGYGTIGFDVGSVAVAKAGVYGRSFYNVGVKALGGRAAINLVPNGTQAAVVAAIAAVKQGDLIVTNEGDLWFADADGSLVKLGGTSTAAANGLYLLDAPARAYDSRSGTAAGFGPLNAAAGARTISLTTGTAAGATVPAVPAGATGALVSVTLDATTASGFLALFGADITWPGNSNLNWYTAGQILAVTTVTKVDAAGKIKLQVGGGGSTQIVVDVIGYYA